MKRSLGLSLVAATLLAGNAMAMDLAGGKLTGDARALYMSDDDGTNSENALGLGINPTFSMDVGSGLSVEAGLGIAFPLMESTEDQAANFAMAKSPATAGDGSEMYATLTKANVTYGAGDAFVKAGYQQLDTPLAGSDDIRLVPNSFMAAVVGYTGVKNMTFIVADVLSMAGKVDSLSSEDPEAYNSMSDAALGGLGNDNIDDKDVKALAAVYGNEEAGANGQLWYYMMDEPADGVGAISAMYLDAGMAFGNINVAAQYMTFACDIWSNSATGLKVDAAFGDVSVVAAMNNYSLTVDDATTAAAIGGVNAPAWYAWGGYPEYAVADEMWAGSANWDGGSSTKLAATYSGVEKLGLTAAYVIFSDVATVTDLIAEYEVSEEIGASFVYEMASYDDDNTDDTTGMKLKATYSF